MTSKGSAGAATPRW